MEMSEKNQKAKQKVIDFLKNLHADFKIIKTSEQEQITGLPYKDGSNLLNRMVKKGYLSKVKVGVFAFKAERPSTVQKKFKVITRIQPVPEDVMAKMAKMRAAKQSGAPKGELVGYKLIKLYPGCKYQVGHFEPLGVMSEKLSKFPELWKPVHKAPKFELTEKNKTQIQEAIEYMEVALTLLKKSI